MAAAAPLGLARSLLQSLRAADKSYLVYDHTAAVAVELDASGSLVEEAPSVRAQEQPEGADGDGGGAQGEGGGGEAASGEGGPALLPLLPVPVCGACGGGDGELLHCLLCSKWYHAPGGCDAGNAEEASSTEERAPSAAAAAADANGSVGGGDDDDGAASLAS